MSPLDAVLAWLGADALASPLWLAVLLPIALLALAGAWLRPLPALPWPGIAEARAAGALGFDPVSWLALLLRAGALGLLALVVAGPVSTHELGGRRGEGLDLVLVLDISGSMRAVDAKVRGEPRTRLDLARAVVTRFALHRVAGGDRVGLVVFGGQAYTQSPLTSDGRLLEAALERVEPGAPNEPTALGDGLALAVRRTSAGSEEPPAATGPAEGRLVVLLTDGRSNAGAIPVDVAASIAAARHTRVHTVGIGAEHTGPLDRAAASARGTVLTDLDRETLQRIADTTGGRFFAAQSSRDLEAVYREIDALERVPRPKPPQVQRAPLPEPFLAAAGALLLGEILIGRVAARRIP